MCFVKEGKKQTIVYFSGVLHYTNYSHTCHLQLLENTFYVISGPHEAKIASLLRLKTLLSSFFPFKAGTRERGVDIPVGGPQIALLTFSVSPFALH